MKDEFFVVDLADGSYLCAIRDGHNGGMQVGGSVGNPLLAKRFYDESNGFAEQLRDVFPKARFVKIVATAEVIEL